MLPLRLTVENFMPYRGRQPVLELAGLGIACLSGENGAGKSSLLDALTWTLWGHSRAGDQDDPLVSAGESEMWAELEFRAREGRYRVIRRHRKSRGGSRPGQTSVELQAWDGNAFRPLSGTSARDTQKQIVELLHLDYDTFVRTAFLKQGQADLFTMERPADRKRLLGEILGLSYYERLAERAREETRDREKLHYAASRRLEDLDRQLASERPLQDELVGRQNTLEELRPRLAAALEETQRLEDEAGHLAQMQADLRGLREQTTRLEAELQRLDLRRAALAGRITEAESVAVRQSEIEAGYAALEEARAAAQAHGERAGQFAMLTERRAALEKKIAAARAGLEYERASLEAQALGLREVSSQTQAIASRRAQAEKERADLDLEWETQTSRVERLKVLEGELQSRQARMSQLRQEGEDLSKRLALLVEEPEGRCPLCGSEVGAHGLAQIRDHYRERGTEIVNEIGELNKQALAFRKERDLLDAETRREAARLRQETAKADALAGRLRADEERATQAAQELEKILPQVLQARIRLENGDYAPIEQAVLAELAKQTELLSYDPVRHKAAVARVVGLDHWEGERRRLEAALATLPQDKTLAVELEQRAQDFEAQLAESAERGALLADAVEQAPVLQEKLAQARAQAAKFQGGFSATEDAIRTLRVRLEELERRRDERSITVAEVRQMAEEKVVYEELAAAFGVRGVQAMLIETALPELEEEANALLTRLTDNRMHVTLQTQRQTRAGGQQETLDILIADEWGTRPYELYSGGEAFRVNFALRVGLSKLLARRAGAQVPLLFVDEGFGTQDAAGRERLVEAISSLRQDPAYREGLILVITHMDDIKDQFDARIEVAKTERGSTFRVVGA